MLSLEWQHDQNCCFISASNLEKIRFIYYSKKVLHHLISTTFLSNILYKFTKNIFLIKYCCGGLDSLSDTINLCGKKLLKSVKMHFSGNTEIWVF